VEDVDISHTSEEKSDLPRHCQLARRNLAVGFCDSRYPARVASEAQPPPRTPPPDQDPTPRYAERLSILEPRTGAPPTRGTKEEDCDTGSGGPTVRP